MDIIQHLASSQGRRDEVPNQELAQKIVSTKDKKSVQELVKNLHNKDKNIQSDCIKALDEIGVLEPSLISGYARNFLGLLDSKNNRLQWGAMAALDNITPEIPGTIHDNLSTIIAAADKGSVITRDRAVAILVKLYAITKYTDDAFALFNEQLQAAPTNQLPMYAEMMLSAITAKHKAQFAQSLVARLDDIEKESKRKRVEKVMAKLNK